MASKESSALWMDPGAYTLPLLAMVIDELSMEATEWDPGTIAMEIEESFGVKPPPLNMSKALAGITLLTTNDFYTSPVDFAALVLTMNCKPAGILPDALSCAWGLTEGMLIMPPDDDDENPFSAEILALLGQILKIEGILNPPDVLRIATHDSSLLEAAKYSWSDDEEMFQMISEFERSKTEEINQTVQDRAMAMFRQLQTIPLQNGSAAETTSRMIAGLARTRDSSSKLPEPIG